MPSPVTAIKDFSAVVITGGSSGIGKSYIGLLSELCPELAFCNLSRRKPDIINKKLKLRHISCDLSKPEQVVSGLLEVRDFLEREVPTGKILLINNSGFGIYGNFPEPGTDQQLEMVDVNVRTVVQMTGKLLPLLKARGGAIITIASTAAFQPTPYLGTYGATKAFVLNWSLALNEELRVRVSGRLLFARGRPRPISLSVRDLARGACRTCLERPARRLSWLRCVPSPRAAPWSSAAGRTS